ncbi:HAD-like domain-containing protein [Hypoxylon rubiginosum]|uniref:HAD-like domain-containing protein n=1 Tax=Hypoxylon rubiginosum TaxID=110542 RepID=A0ACB9YSN7_9PEZI|nr:HAD-like domain-containing protein [Hypoxylon rubiginosum]
MHHVSFSFNALFYHATKRAFKQSLAPHSGSHLYTAISYFSVSVASSRTSQSGIPDYRRSPKGKKYFQRGPEEQQEPLKKYDRSNRQIMYTNNEPSPYNHHYSSYLNAAAPTYIPSAYQGSAPQQQHLPPSSNTPVGNPANYPYQYPHQPSQFNAPYPAQPSGPFVPNMTNKNNKEKGIKREKKTREKKVEPSAESGGVPDPTPAYLAAASLPPFTLPHPRKILVVIDLNGTVLYRPDQRRSPTAFVERAHARAFLRYCVETFLVVIWSSAKPQNVTRMCDQLLSPDQRARVVAVWSRDRFGLSAADYGRRVVCYKRLAALWADPAVRASHPDYESAGKVWDQSSTVLIDDTIEKGRAEPYNLVAVPEFAGDVGEPGDVLAQVHDYVNTCASQTDVSAYIRTHPFRADPNHVLRPHPAAAPAQEEEEEAWDSAQMPGI